MTDVTPRMLCVTDLPDPPEPPEWDEADDAAIQTDALRLMREAPDLIIDCLDAADVLQTALAMACTDPTAAGEYIEHACYVEAEKLATREALRGRMVR